MLKRHKEYTGVVTSSKMDKTITVRIDYFRKDGLYGKRTRVSKKFHAHDENNIAKEGDFVTIFECRPISKLKHFALKEVIEPNKVNKPLLEEANDPTGI
jgi:small subunit ribosomal protein S17